MSLIYDQALPANDFSAHYSEWFLLTRDLAEAVRSRKNTLRGLLTQEINSRPGKVDVVDVACGPCQSLREALCSIEDPRRINLTAIDTDELMQHNNRAFFVKARNLNFDFQTANALRVHHAPESIDIIYSTGLYDYLSSSSLAKLWRRTFEAVKPGGVAILSMKDCTKFCPLFYRWAIEWNQFHLRTDKEILAIVEEAGLPPPTTIHRDSTGIIMLMMIYKR